MVYLFKFLIKLTVNVRNKNIQISDKTGLVWFRNLSDFEQRLKSERFRSVFGHWVGRSDETERSVFGPSTKLHHFIFQKNL